MTRLTWVNPNDDIYEVGVDRGVFYPKPGIGVSWNGLLWIADKPAGADVIPYFIDGVKYLSEQGSEAFMATITAYMYPEELDNNQNSSFGLCYRTRIGTSEHYKLHIVYNLFAAPAVENFTTLNSSPEAMQFSWDATALPITIFGNKPAAHLIIDTRIAYSWVVSVLENALYGSVDVDPYLPNLNTVLDMFDEGSILKITDNGDGTWTAEGPDDVVYMIDTDIFEIDWPSAVITGLNTYNVRSL